jgi:hypothetical protein
VRWQDLAYDADLTAVRVRKEMEAMFAPPARAVA